jgi:PAS domain S-box-containing protein
VADDSPCPPNRGPRIKSATEEPLESQSAGRSCALSAEEELEQTTRRLDAIINNTKMAIFMMDDRQQCAFMNKAAEELTGYTFEETLGRPLHDVIHHTRPDGQPYPIADCPIDRSFPEANQVEGEETFVHKDGHFYPVAFIASPVRDEDGKTIGTVIEARNVEREKAQDEAVRENEQRFRAVFENAGVGMLEFDAGWRILGANRVYSEITGYPQDELIGQSCLAFTHPGDRDRSEDALRTVRSGEAPGVSFEKRYIRKNGDVVWIRSNVARLGDETSRFLKIVEDITEAKAGELALVAAQEALRDSEERLRLVVDTAVDAIVVINEEGNILAFNPAAERMFGYSRDEAIGENVKVLMPEPHRRQHDSYIDSYRKTGRRKIIGIGREVEGLRKDGSLFPLDLSIAEGTDGRGRRFFTGVMRDITERKAAETALREESHNLEILNSVGTALSGELDLERVVQMVTDAGVDLNGAKFGAYFYNIEDDQGESYMLFTLSGAERSEFEKFGMPRNTKVFAPTFEGKSIVRSDDITKDPRYGHNPPHKGMPEGHLPVRSYLAVPVVGRTGEGIGGLFFGHPEPRRFEERHEKLMAGIAAQAAIAIDNAQLFRSAQREIEQRVAAEQALTALNETLESRVLDEIDRRSRAEEALRQAQKMETVGQLSGGIAHDFNNLLQVIHGNLSLLQQALPADEAKWQRAVGNAITGTERAAALTRRLLAFSRRQPLDPRPVDLNRLITDMSELLRRTLGETVRVEMDLTTAPAVAEVDLNQIENSLLNLSINARDAMADGGVLRIATATVELSDEFIQDHPDAIPGEYVRVTVEDNGEGMSPELLARAIEPFFTTKEVGRGTGLGLSMVYGFIKQSGGYLDLRSEVGEGTTVDLYLPRAKGDAELQSEPRHGELARGNGETILLCEDEEDVRRFSAESLGELGYRVVEAEDASAALRLLRELAPIDLLFTDVVLPGGKNGAELARDAREIQPGLKVLFTTGYARSALDETAIEGGVEVLPKPFSVQELAQRLRQMLQ